MSCKSILAILVVLLSQVCVTYAQGGNQCTDAEIAACGQHPCIKVGNTAGCLCTDMSVQASAAACSGGFVTSTISPIIPNQCTNAVCPAGATCVPTNQNPSLYVCVCPNNVLANPDCPTTPLANNPCLTSNPCQNGGICVVNPLTLQAVCLCPTGSYEPNCAYSCNRACGADWCYNCGRCANAYDQPSCLCGQNCRGRRCEL